MFFPPRCLVCRKVLGGGALCPDCRQRLERLRLEKGWVPLPGGEGRAFSLFAYQEPAVRAVLAFKRRRHRRAAADLAGEMARALQAEGCPWQLVTAVPCAAGQKRSRGHNHAAVLAGELAGCLGLPFRGELLRREPGPQQHALPARLRWENARALYRAGTGQLQGEAVLLVDDVMTTGATLQQCARLLRQMGAGRVDCATLCRTGRQGQQR